MSILTWTRLAGSRACTPLRLLLTAIVLTEVAIACVTRNESAVPPLDFVPLIACTLGAGLLGLDRGRGLLGVILTRPITRQQYVLGRWSGLFALVMLTQVLLMGVVIALAAFIAREKLPYPGELLDWTWQVLLTSACGASVLVLASSILSGTADAVLVTGAAFLLVFGDRTWEALGAEDSAHPITREALRFLLPRVDPSSDLERVLTTLASGAACLLLAVIITNMREVHSRGEA